MLFIPQVVAVMEYCRARGGKRYIGCSDWLELFRMFLYTPASPVTLCLFSPPGVVTFNELSIGMNQKPPASTRETSALITTDSRPLVLVC